MLLRRLLLGSVLLLILLGSVITVRKPWTKTEGERSEDALPGILPRPAPLASRRWQLETVSPRSMMHSIAWSPDGLFIALGTDVGNLRVYAAETGNLVRLLTGHASGVLCVAWSPDGERLASASRDNTVRLWSAEGTPGAVLQHDGPVWSVAWSPDGRQLASATTLPEVGGYRTVTRLWSADGSRNLTLTGDARSDKPLKPMQPVSQVRDFEIAPFVVWSPDGNWLASFSGAEKGYRNPASASDSRIRLWSAKGELGAVLEHDARVRDVTWSPDGKLLATATTGMGFDNGKLSFKPTPIQLWSVDGTRGPTLEGHTGPIKALAWSPGGTWLASASAGQVDNTVRLWSADGTPGPVWEARTRAANSIAWSPDGERLALGGYGDVLMWQRDGTPGPQLKLPTGTITVNWSPDGRRLAAAAGRPGGDSGEYSTVRVWEMDDREKPVIEIQTVGIGASVIPSPDGRQLALERREDVRLWKWDGMPGPIFNSPFKTGIGSIAWSPDGKWLAARGLYETTIQLWHADGTAGPLLKGARRGVSSGGSIAWSPDGKQLASEFAASDWRSENPIEHDEHAVRLWSVDGTPGPLLEGHSGSIRWVAWSPDGRHLATAGSDGTVRFWEPDGTPGPVFEGSPLGLGACCVAWSPNSKLLAAAWSDRTMRLWAADGTLGPLFEGPDGNRISIRWSPDSTRLAAWDTTGRDPAISLWFSDGTAIDVLKGHEDKVATIAWSPDGERLASASWDKTVRLWSARGEPGPVLEHQERVWSIAWSPDGTRLASGGGTVMLWDIDAVEPQWVGVLFSNKRSVTFSAAGKILHGRSDLIEQQFVYVVEDSGGRLDILKPSKFYELQPD
jgi:WD40 repeat protein